MEEVEVSLRQQAWKGAIDCFGTAHIFERRARRLKYATRALDFGAVGVPAVVGALALADWLTGWVLAAATLLLLLQLTLAVWSATASWTERLGFCSQSAADNSHLSRRYRRLAEAPPRDTNELRRELELIHVEYDYRSRSDEQQHVTERERKRGHRAGLRQFGRACHACGRVPGDMTSTDCGVCGQFKRKSRARKKER
ncbi:MAG: mobilome CxxCx(11)CxxC protein [Dehalococcoidia bacterium]